jgi:transposase
VFFCRPKTKGKVEVDDFERRVIRDMIQEFYLVKKFVLTVRKLMPVLKEKINWRWSATSLRRLLKDMGFVWKGAQSKRLFLIERSDIVQ